MSDSVPHEQDVSRQREVLRRQLRQLRLALSPREQEMAAAAVHDRVARSTLFNRARRIAFYLPANAELDARPLLQHALAQGKHCYLPTLSPLQRGKMYFVRVRAGQWLMHNRWGISEPALRSADIVHPMGLDLVLMPLLGFDAEGNRLGMGMGFYDRAFAFRCDDSKGTLQRHSPRLLGLAHDCQQVERIPARAWDVPVDRVITPSGSHLPITAARFARHC